MSIKLTKAWKINGMLVAADNYEDAINIYKEYVKDVKINSTSEDGEYVLVKYN